MIAIITEKSSVGLEIARIVGATEKHGGYMEGNGYLVTWASGHLVSLALPAYYGLTKPSATDLPIIPDPFQLTVRQFKTPKGPVTDRAASKQLNVIDEVFNRAGCIINGCDSGREGELIFRNIYAYLGYTKPCKRLWISSLTDEAIKKGLAGLKDGSVYDPLYMAADSRAKADWLLGLNSSMALAISSGAGNNSLGRVQTPTLAMICKRYKENRNFIPSDYWQVHATLEKDGSSRQFRYTEDINDKSEAEDLFARLKKHPEAMVTKVERKRVFQTQPLLYDLTSLQKDCNIHLDLTAEKTLEIAQSLYGKKLLSYPRTGCRHIPEDVFREIPSLLRMALDMGRFNHLAGGFDMSGISKKPVDDGKITDHHALVITGNCPEGVSGLEETVYHMVAGRMLEAFGESCGKESLLMEVSIGKWLFRSHSLKILTPGWRKVFNRAEDKEMDEKDSEEGMPGFEEGVTVKVCGFNLGMKKTKPKPLYTEAALLNAMETCGKTMADEASREALEGPGLGTPATRAAIISTLFKRDYIRKSGKSLVPTEKGLFIHQAVKGMKIADVEMTANWEKALSDIEKNVESPGTFMSAIKTYTRLVVEEILSFEFPQLETSGIACPKCGTGKVVVRHKLALCDNGECGLMVFRKFLNKELTDQHFQQLFSSGATKLIKGLKGKKGVSFDARLAFDKDFNITFLFPDNKKKSPKPQPGNGGDKVE